LPGGVWSSRVLQQHCLLCTWHNLKAFAISNAKFLPRPRRRPRNLPYPERRPPCRPRTPTNRWAIANSSPRCCMPTMPPILRMVYNSNHRIARPVWRSNSHHPMIANGKVFVYANRVAYLDCCHSSMPALSWPRTRPRLNLFVPGHPPRNTARTRSHVGDTKVMRPANISHACPSQVEAV